MTSRCPDCGKPLPAGVPGWVHGLRVADAMTREPVTLGTEDSLARGMEVMRLHHIRRIPVVMGGRLIGLLAEGDLKRAQPSILDSSEAEFNRVMDGTQIGRIMIRDPLTVAEDTPLLDAVRMLRETKFGALPVMRGESLVGILTDHDAVRCLVDLLSQAG